MNADLAKHWPPIVAKKSPPADVEQWAQVKDKRALLDRG